MIIEIPIDDSMLNELRHRLSFSEIYKGSHRQNGANQVGLLGEIVTERWLSAMGVYFSPDKTTRYDLRLLNGETVDIKTKERTVTPHANYDCSVAMYSYDHQQVDYYFFVSLKVDGTVSKNDVKRFTHAYLLGAANKRQLNALGRLIKKGTVDDDNKMQNWATMRNIRIEQLTGCGDVLLKWTEISPAHSAILDYRNVAVESSRKSRAAAISNQCF